MSGDIAMDALDSIHPTDQTLRAYGVGKLNRTLAESIHSHLSGCGECRQRVAEMSDDTFLGRLRDAQARPDSPAPAGAPFAGVSMTEASPSSIKPAPRQLDSSRSGGPPGLRNPGRAGPGRHGGGLPRPEQAHGPQGSAQGRQPRTHGPPRRPGPLPPRDPQRRPASSPQHRDRLLGDPGRREHRLCDGVCRGPRPGPARQGPRAAAGGPRVQLHLPGGAGPAICPRAGDGAPRHQAEQPDPGAAGQAGPW